MLLFHSFRPIKRALSGVAICLAFISSTYADDTPAKDLPPALLLSTTNWCPYACENTPEAPGFIHEYISLILAQYPLQTDITFYPWQRAVQLAQDATESHGLLTAVPSEAPDMMFSSSPIMHYEVCFFTKIDNDWSYTGLESLKDIKLGAISGYGYNKEIDGYIQQTPEQSEKLFLMSGNNATDRLLKMLQHHRIDAFIEDKLVVSYTLKHSDSSFSVRNAGCLEANPFYMALSPNLPWSGEVITYLSQAFTAEENQALLESLIEKYTE